MARQRAPSLSKQRLRNLKQYKDLPDSEFEDIWDDKVSKVLPNIDFENRINEKLDSFSNDYDLDNLKINDLLTLRALAQAYITLEDYELLYYNLREGGLNLDTILELKNISDIMSTLRSDISKMQIDLGISRKARKGDREESVLSELERLKNAAREFYEQKMMYIFCPKCNSLLSTTWFLYPGIKENKITLKCKSKPDGENECGTVFTVTSKELLDKRGTNSDIVPDGMR